MALPSRRSVLKWTLGSGVLALGGAAALALQKSELRESPPGLQALDAGAYAVLCALADRLCPALGEGAPGALALRVPEKIDAMLSAAPDPLVAQQVMGALAMLENALAGAVFLERFAPFTKLAAEEQDAVLTHMRDSSVGVRRTVFRALAVMVWAVYWSSPETWQRAGYVEARTTEGLREMYKDQLVDLHSLRAGA
jgi:hypothetical protein